MDSSWKNLQIRMEAAWNMRTTPKTKRPKTGDIISSAHSLDWNKKKVRQLQQQWNDEVTKLVADRNKAISDVMVDILTLIRMDIKSASSVLISHDAAKMLWEKAYEYGHANGFTDAYHQPSAKPQEICSDRRQRRIQCRYQQSQDWCRFLECGSKQSGNCFYTEHGEIPSTAEAYRDSVCCRYDEQYRKDRNEHSREGDCCSVQEEKQVWYLIPLYNAQDLIRFWIRSFSFVITVPTR